MHAPEPWAAPRTPAWCEIIESADGATVAECFQISPSNVARIVACINLLAGVPIEKINAMLAGEPVGREYIRSLIKSYPEAQPFVPASAAVDLDTTALDGGE
jgi:hypothetical protein